MHPLSYQFALGMAVGYSIAVLIVVLVPIVEEVWQIVLAYSARSD